MGIPVPNKPRKSNKVFSFCWTSLREKDEELRVNILFNGQKEEKPTSLETSTGTQLRAGFHPDTPWPRDADVTVTGLFFHKGNSYWIQLACFNIHLRLRDLPWEAEPEILPR